MTTTPHPSPSLSRRVRLPLASVLLIAALGASCARDRAALDPPQEDGRVPAASVQSLPAPLADRPTEYPGIHNVVAFHDGVYSGSMPHGDEGFDSLAVLGIRTILSVDGSAPEVEAAEARGMRYIHLPIGYDGIDAQRRLEIARAVRDARAQGPVFIHCHHGKHRSAAAAASAAVILGWSTPDEMVARMKISRTSPSYTGLYACAATGVVVDSAILDAVDAKFPSVQRPQGMIRAMVEIDEAFEHLHDIAEAGWVTPEFHPDLVPASEAGRLADLLRDSRETPEAKALDQRFDEMMVQSWQLAQAVERMLADEPSPGDPAWRASLDAALEVLGTTCIACHEAYRN